MNNHNKINDQLLDIAYKLSSSLELQFILNKITEERTLTLLSSKRATIYLLDNKKEFLEPVATLGSSNDAKVMSQKLDVKSSLSGKVVQAEKGMIFNNTSQYPDSYHIPGTPDVEDENLIVLPLIVEKEIFGTLNLYRSKKLYSKKDLEFAKIFALYASTAIQNAQVHQNLILKVKEHMKTEEDLMQKDYIINSASSAIATSDLEGNMIYANPVFLEWWGINNPKEFIGRSFSNYWIIDDIYDEIISILGNEGVWTGELQAKRKDGSIFFVQVSAALVRDNKGNPVSFMSSSVDITERKKAEIALQKEKAFSNTLIEQSPTLFVTIDRNKKIITMNNKMLEICGYELKEVINKEYIPLFIIPRQKKQVNAIFDTLIHEKIKEPTNSESYIRTKDGKENLIEWYGNQVFDSKGELDFFIGIGIDITEKKKAERTLVESEEKYRTIVENTPSVIWKSQEDGTTVYISDNIEEIYGFTPEEIYKGGTKLWFDRIHKDDRKLVQNNFKELFNGTKTFVIEYRIKCKDGEWIWLRDIANVVIEVKGEKIAYGVFTDITREKQNQLALISSENKFSKLFHTSPNVITISSIEDGTMIDINDIGIRELGFTREEFIGKTSIALKLISPSDRESLINTLKEDGSYSNIELEIRLKSGEIRHGLFNGQIITLNEQQFLFQTIVDISDIKKTEQALRESEEKFSKAFHSGPDTITITRLEDGLYVDVNEAFCRLSGYKKEEVIGKTTKELNIFKNIKDREKLLDIGVNKHHLSNIEMEFKHKKGEIIYGLASFELIDIDDKPHILTIVKDITEKKKADIALKESEEKYISIFDNANDSIFLIKDEIIVEVNKRAEEMFGKTKEELINIKPWDPSITQIYFDDESAKEFGSKQLAWSLKKKTDKFEWIHLKSDGTPFNVEVSLSKIILKGVQYAHAIVRDVTDKKRDEQELNIAYEEIKELKDKIQAENIYLKKTVKLSNLHKDIVGNSRQIEDLVEKALQVAPMDSNVLLLGETGTGKELITKGIHDASKRKEKMLVTVNCAAIPDALIESELFGYEKGAFTDAHNKKIGLFEIADKSTIFLDEIGEMPLNAQSKLLRVIENKEVLRIGGNQPVKIDVRIIAATNQDLPSLVKDKKFRQDLYYRLNVFPIELPPLRTRKQDIKPLVEKFVEDFNQHMGKKVTTIPKKVLKDLENYSWPGNVRELRNVIERSMITTTGSSIKIKLNQIIQTSETEITTLEDVERNHIREVLETTYWKISGKGSASDILNINPSTLRSRMKKLGISKPK